LKKYKLDKQGYKISVQSNNQSGGQTAFIITNNYYKDPNLIPDSINYVYSITNENGRKVLTISPKSNAWIQPIVFYDSSDVDMISKKVFPLPAMITNYTGIFGGFNVPVNVKGAILQNACTSSSPLHIYLNGNPDEFYYFGDYADDYKRYLYFKGKVVFIPSKR
jgi:hypothetical protein